MTPCPACGGPVTLFHDQWDQRVHATCPHGVSASVPLWALMQGLAVAMTR